MFLLLVVSILQTLISSVQLRATAPLSHDWRERIGVAILSDLSSEKADEIDTIFDQLTAALKKVEIISPITGKPTRKYKKRAAKTAVEAKA